MIVEYSNSTHPNRETVNLYAAPHINAEYYRDEISATKWMGDYPQCAVCGRTNGSFAVHHEPPRSKGSLILCTPMGKFVIKPTLILLCKECHEKRHDGRLSFRWEWNTQEDEEKFWNGDFFSHEMFWDHSRLFKEHGRLVVSTDGKEWAL
jgi:5-methylcytosine-specific restriction endonuclease McrA